MCNGCNSATVGEALNPHLGSHVLTCRLGEREYCQEEGHHAGVQSLPTERHIITHRIIFIFLNKLP